MQACNSSVRSFPVAWPLAISETKSWRWSTPCQRLTDFGLEATAGLQAFRLLPPSLSQGHAKGLHCSCFFVACFRAEDFRSFCLRDCIAGLSQSSCAFGYVVPSQPSQSACPSGPYRHPTGKGRGRQTLCATRSWRCMKQASGRVSKDGAHRVVTQ